MFSDLQFEVSSCTANAKIQNDLQNQVQQLQNAAVQREAVIQDLTSKLSESLERVEALEDQLRWKEVEHRNEIDSKESKIVELRQNLNVNSEINRLQNECKKLYELSRGSARERIDQVAGWSLQQFGFTLVKILGIRYS